jgi:hypothetical protein
MTMEKYGVSSVQEAQREALGVAKAKLMNLLALEDILAKTAEDEQKISQLRAEIVELEEALKSQ